MRPLEQLQATLDAMTARFDELEQDRDALYDRVSALEDENRQLRLDWTALTGALLKREGTVTPGHAIVAAACMIFSVTAQEVTSRRRSERIARARYAIALVATELTPMSTTEIGRLLDRDHSTIAHGIRRGGELVRSDETFALRLRMVREAVQAVADGSTPDTNPGIESTSKGGPVGQHAYSS